MGSEAEKPVILLAFANERVDQASYLRNLPEEARNIREILESAKRDGLCDYKEIPNATLKEILDVFQNPSYKDRIAIFHYAGHANSYQLLLESPEGRTTAAYAGGLAAFLGQQTGLELVFLNGCATQKQVQGLLNANVSAVISTSRAIDDRAAKEFATRFYTGLAAGSSIRRAYNEAEAAMKTAHGDDSRSLYAREGSAIDQVDDRVPLDRDRLPWDPGPSPGIDLAAQWVMATEFASRLYKGLVGGDDIQRAYSDAKAAIQTAGGNSSRNLYVAECRSVDMVDDRLPWDLCLREGAEKADQWSLPNAVKDPLFGLPLVPEGDLPPSPFRHLNWFGREHAEVFFGRGQEIRELYQRVTDGHSAPIILFYGQSGVGKSSVLAAGLFPRLEKKYEIRYVRRDSKKGLLGTLNEELSPKEGMTIYESWLDLESRTKRHLIVMVDQVEEAFTRPNPDLPHELDDFWDALQAIFSDPAHRPKGKLILGFRKEWVAEIEKQLVDREIPFSGLLLEPLKREGIIESVNGPAKSERLRQKYRLAVEDGLAEIIADDLLEDRESAIAPAMQILLTKMWEVARKEDCDKPFFDRILYQSLKKKGILLQDFLDQQLNKMDLEVVNSGLALDVLAFHTTSLGTAEERTEEVIQKTYQHQIPVVKPLIQQCVDLYLLEKLDKEKVATRLSHDTLAPLIRKRFADSDKPGQRARRILESRSVDWQDDKQGAPLDESDLELVEQGKDGMRAWETAEERLIEASRVEREKKRATRRFWGRVGIAIVILIILFALWADINRREADEQKNQFLRLYLAKESDATRLDTGGFIESILLAVESLRHDESREGNQALRNSLALLPLRKAIIEHKGGFLSMDFSPDGKYLGIGDSEGTLQIFDMTVNGLIQENQKQQYGNGITDVDFSPDGTYLATSHYDGTLSIIDRTKDGEQIPPIKNSDFINSISFSPNGSLIAFACMDGLLRIWDIADNKVVRDLFAPNDGLDYRDIAYDIAFSPDGKYIAAGCASGEVTIWDLQNASKSAIFLLHERPVKSIAFSPDGSYLATGCSDYTANVWDLSSKKKISEFKHDRNVESVAFSPDGRCLAVASADGIAKIWDWISRKEIAIMEDFQSNHYRSYYEWRGGVVPSEIEPPDGRIAFSPDGRFLVEEFGNVSVIWNLTTFEEKVLVHDWTVNSMDFSPDGKYIAAANGCNITIWDWNNSTKFSDIDIFDYISHGGWVESIAYDPQEGYLAAAISNDVVVLNMLSHEKLSHIDAGCQVKSLDFSFDGKNLALGCQNGVVNLWDWRDKAIIAENNMSYPVSQVKFNKGGRLLSILSSDEGSEESVLVVWEWIEDKELLNLVNSKDNESYLPFIDASFGLDGRCIAIADGDRARIIDLSTNRTIYDIDQGSPISSIEFSPDGEFLAIARDDKIAAILDISKGSIWDTLKGTIWGIPKRNEIIRLSHKNFLVDSTFSPDGKYLAVIESPVLTESGKIIRVWTLHSDDLIREACSRVNRNLTIAEWSKYLDESDCRTCPHEGRFNRSKTSLWESRQCEPCIRS